MTARADGFLWGAATAAYQIEGAVREDGRGPSIWDTFSHTPGRVTGDATGDLACDHYRRVEEDVALMRDLGLTAYRFSIAWPRVVPDGDGRVEPRGLDFYARLVRLLRDAGIEPVVTLYHWDLPQVLQDRGGWSSRETADAFVRYAAVVHDALGRDVRYWTTLNEPWCSAMLGYGSGQHAPGITDPRAALRAAHHLLLAHGEAVRVMRDIAGDGHAFSLVLNLLPAVAASDAPGDLAAARMVDGIQNRLWLEAALDGAYPEDVWPVFERYGAADVILPGDLERIAQPLDLLGLNYYHQYHVRAGAWRSSLGSAYPGCEEVEFVPNPEPTTEMGWGVEPHGLEAMLLRLHREGRPPVIITENGAAYDDRPGPDGEVDDPDRLAFLDAHLQAVARARGAGADVRGYFAWSLMDNFEWAHGYTKRFGLAYVDYATQRRTLKASGRWYRDLVARGGLEPTMEATR